MIKVFITIDHLGLGGAQRQVFEYLKLADRSRFEFKVITLNGDETTLSAKIRDLGINVIVISHQGFFSFKTLCSLIRLFRSEKPDIVHTYLFTSDFYGRLAAVLARVRLIIRSVRDRNPNQKMHQLLMNRFLNRYTDQVIVNAEAIRPFLLEYEHLPIRKTHLIYNGMDFGRFENLRDKKNIRADLNIPVDALVVGMIGRFSLQKDYEAFLKAAFQISQNTKNIYFLAVGDGVEKERIQDISITKYPQVNFVFTGQRKDIPDIINAMDVGVLATHHEGFPNVVMEYMASGTPVVATNLDGCAELIVDGESGYLVPEADADQLAAKIKALIADPVLRERIGSAGRKRVEENFTSKKLASNIENLYTRLTSPKVGFILSQFPTLSETFILREFIALSDKGLNFEIYSLKPCKDKIMHEQARAFLPQTSYAAVFPVHLFLKYLFLNPLKLFRAYWAAISVNSDTPFNFLKSQVTFFRSLSFISQMKRHNVKYIHSHWATMPTTSAEIVAHVLKVPYSFTAHAWDIFLSRPDNLRRKIKTAQQVVTCTQYNKKYLTKLEEESADTKIIVNYHGVDIENFSFNKTNVSGEKIILAIGRLVEQKGFEFLIKACWKLQRKGISLKCIIVGEGPLRNNLERLIARLHVEHIVNLIGAQKQDAIKDLYRKAALLVVPSVIASDGDRDGIPNVIFEAMAAGVPIIASDVSGIPEAVVDKQTGVVVASKDTNALAQAIDDIVSKKIDTAVFVRNARVKVQQDFEMQKNAEVLIDLFPAECLI